MVSEFVGQDVHQLVEGRYFTGYGVIDICAWQPIEMVTSADSGSPSVSRVSRATRMHSASVILRETHVGLKLE